MNFEHIPKSNLHTHTRFADGKHTAEEVVLSAIEKGMEVIGFSEHSYNGRNDVYGMKDEETVAAYRAEIQRLQKAYGERIRILLGIEQDSFGGIPTAPYDYVLGSVHYVYLGGEFCAVDHSRAVMEDAIRRHCGGDPFVYTKEYYRLVAEVEKSTQCDIVGHFDLVTKFNEGGAMFDESDPRYVRPALEALDALLEKDVIFEVNTGAISRGYRTTPYPATVFLRRIAEKRGTITVNADSHHKDTLTYAFDQAFGILKASGIGSVLVMTRDGWKSYPL